MATGEAPVLETIAEMTAVSLSHSELDPATVVMLRLAALAAVDAPAASYLMHVGPGAEAGVTVDDVQDVLVAVAPIIGTARTLSAASKIVDALGFTIALLEAEAEAESE
jgi:alkylhydroperoxidase/carboxymuconolactone decarboxylase family protein YurZ